MNDLPVCPNNNFIDLTDDDQPVAMETNSPEHSSDLKVPKEYEHILLNQAFVKLTKYDNIEKEFNTPVPQTHNKR